MKHVILPLIIATSFLSCTTKKGEVAFEKDRYFYLYATINDSIEGRFVFDTGASGLYLDSMFLEQHPSVIQSDLDTARMRGAGATGYKSVPLVKDTIRITVGNYTYDFPYSPILKLTDINGENIAGIIGNQFIKNQVLIVDNERSVLKIDSVVNSNRYETVIPVKFINGRIYVPVDLNMNENRKITANLLLDLGCADAIILNTPYAKSLETQDMLPENRKDWTILYGGALGGNSNGSDVRIPSIQLGDDVINYPIISFSNDTLGAFSKTDYDGLLGNEILDRYNYAIDYGNQILYLTKNAQSKESFKSTITGFYAQKTDDMAIVMSIYAQSNAYLTGIRLGDTITAIQSKSLQTLTEREFNDELKPEGKEVTVTVLRNGQPTNISFLLKSLL
jgi:hypothetical protein